jgi:hypothetical protein
MGATLPTSSFIISQKYEMHWGKTYHSSCLGFQTPQQLRGSRMVSVIVMLLPWAILLEETQRKILLLYFLPLGYLICFFSALAGISYPKLFNSLILVETSLYPVSHNGTKRKPAIFMTTIARRSSWPSKSVRTLRNVPHN